jgi:hypothetical protein
MGKILENLHITLAIGVILALGLLLAPYSPGLNGIAIFQWLHVFFGITWIGLLYYFNFVQIPTMPKIPAELKPGVSVHCAERAVLLPLGRGFHRADRSNTRLSL